APPLPARQTLKTLNAINTTEARLNLALAVMEKDQVGLVGIITTTPIQTPTLQPPLQAPPLPARQTLKTLNAINTTEARLNLAMAVTGTDRDGLVGIIITATIQTPAIQIPTLLPPLQAPPLRLRQAPRTLNAMTLTNLHQRLMLKLGSRNIPRKSETSSSEVPLKSALTLSVWRVWQLVIFFKPVSTP
ncbi:MAG: hypothetical protein M1835_003374, partial [Candelina submexicana]